ncbi:MAG: ankyrin repeat domain-containing protein [Deltaproteobacteria bacterium]|nr:ankyrin repeat domain-containing protein [Deltaproteobacteria bacterium]
MKRLSLKKITPMCLPLARGEFKRGVVLIISAILLLLVGMALIGCVPPLHDAASKGDTRTAKELLDKGANVDEGLSRTPLMSAASKGHLEFVKLLVERGANVNAVYRPGRMSRTPLAFAAMNGHKEIVKYLVDKGADIDKTILALRKATTTIKVAKKDNQIAIEFLQEFKREMADATQQKRVQTAALDKASPTIKSDVDELPAIKANPNKNAYAIVIGIENYRQKLPKADFATSDAKLMSEYLTRVMGYPEENVVTLTNDHAALGDFVKYFEKWLPNNVENGSTVLVYYSGHGAPNPKTGDAYLVPYDGDPSFIDQTGYSLKRLYESLNKLQAKEIIVALDSCFSGAGGRSVLAKGARPLVMNLQSNMVVSKNITVLSASSGEQISSTYDEKGHGLFTYFMLKGIKNEDVVKQDGSIKMDDLFSYIKPQVERIARKQYNNEQTPQLIGAKK